jgi:hypothetical protein
MAEYSNLSKASNPDNLIPCCAVTGWLPCNMRDIYSFDTNMANALSITANYRACCTDVFCGVCLPTDTDDECCVLATVASKQVMPTTCIKINGQCLCCDARYVCPAEKKDSVAEEEIPCVCALGGITCCVDNETKIGCMQKIGHMRGQPSGGCVEHNCDPSCLCDGEDAPIPPPAPTAEEANEKGNVWKEKDDVPDDYDMKESTGKTPAEDLYPCFAGCCFISSCFWKFPDVFGCYTQQSILFLKSQTACYKPLVRKGDIFENDIMQNQTCRWALHDLEHCMKCQGMFQCCCIDKRCAVPCTDDVPCTINCCFINCWAWGNCACDET